MADVAGELADDGVGFRYPIVVLAVPRRGGKSVAVLGVMCDRMEVINHARCWYTAQRREDAAKLFRDEWVPMLEGSPRLIRKYKLREVEVLVLGEGVVPASEVTRVFRATVA